MGTIDVIVSVCVCVCVGVCGGGGDDIDFKIISAKNFSLNFGLSFDKVIPTIRNDGFSDSQRWMAMDWR